MSSLTSLQTARGLDVERRADLPLEFTALRDGAEQRLPARGVRGLGAFGRHAARRWRFRLGHSRL
jgi:hypothetical protein